MKPSASRFSLHFLTLLSLLLSLAGGAMAVTPAQADAHTVSDCSSPSGNANRLVDQIAAAASGDTINFSCSAIISLAARITIPNNLTIDGTGQAVTISGGNAVAMFLVNSGTSLTLNQLTFVNGYTAAENGGVISNAGTLTISNGTFTGNHAPIGGAIFNDHGTLTISNSTFSSNSAETGAGAIYNNGILNIANSTIDANYTNASGHGGGIGNSGIATIMDSTFSGNLAYVGGGISSGADSTLTITNSTFSDNIGSFISGAIYNYGTATIANFSGNSGYYNGGAITNDLNMSVTNSTFSGNTSLSGSSIFSNDGFGIGADVILRNTLLANGTGGNCGGGAIINAGNNIDDGSTCAWGSASGSMSSTNPKLGALGNFGGPTMTFLLQGDSPAINAGNDTTCAAAAGAPDYGAGGFDQRGIARPQGTHCDIGSTESTVQPGPNFVVDTLAGTDDLACDAAPGDCTLAEAIHAANHLAGAHTISFALSGTITLGSTLPTFTNTTGVTIDGSGQFVTINGDNKYRLMFINSGGVVVVKNLILGNGRVAESGGGIYNAQGNLAVINSTLSTNTSNGASGGGIYNWQGTLTVKNSTFSGNNALGGGGGAIYNDYGTISVINSTFSGNNAANGGGAIYNDHSQGLPDGLAITNSTFSGNISNPGSSLYNASGPVTLHNTILATGNALWGNCIGTITNGGNNLDDGETCNWGFTSGSMSSTNPKLALLGDYGGPTQTYALLAGSPAINTGNDAICTAAPVNALDQRGLTRPQGTHCDIGAYEAALQSGPPYVVNSLADTDDMVCSSAPGGCTMREAINAANLLAGADTITLSVSGTILLGKTLPIITDPAGLTIDSSGQTVTLNGDHKVRAMQVNPGASLTMDHLTLMNGMTVLMGFLEENCGAGIFNYGTLVVLNSTFSGNTAENGGGICSLGTLTVNNSTFSGNSAATGGGIANSGTLNVTNSTFSTNTAEILGGGIYSPQSTANISNSTFSGNNSNKGGGVSIFQGTMSITNSTFAGNSATVSGAISNFGGTLTLLNSIVAESTSGGNCDGAITDGGNNIDDGTTCSWGTDHGSMSGTNPKLGPLANYGGSTSTFVLLAGSPAIDGVTWSSPNGAPSTDQRGVSRPQGARFDIGAFESQGTPPSSLISIFLPLVRR
jgi:CSLREA domain-containing protein